MCTGKSFSEARNICGTCWVPKLFWMSKQNKQNNFCTTVYTTCFAGILSLQFSWTINNLSSYCGLVYAKIRASDKVLPVTKVFEKKIFCNATKKDLKVHAFM